MITISRIKVWIYNIQDTDKNRSKEYKVHGLKERRQEKLSIRRKL